MKKRVLVTGATGFIGTNFLEHIKENSDFEVTAVFHNKQPFIQARNIHYLQSDLQSLQECRRIVKGQDYLYMFAGKMSTTAMMIQNPLGPVAENTILNAQMLAAAYEAGVKKYLWLSSTTGYPQLDRPMEEKDFFVGEPPSPYEPTGWMVRYIEKLSFLYATKPKRPMTVIALRPTAVFGEYDDFNFETCHALPALLRRVVERKSPIEIWGSGDDRRDWIYVGDVIDACLLAMEKVEGFGAFNVGMGRSSYNLNEILIEILKMENFEEAEIVHHMSASSTVLHRCFDCSLASSAFNFTAKTSLQTAIANTIRWYKANETQNLTSPRFYQNL
ncbi:MAG: hypothetical protein A2W61_03030 [Deltaproteobacteria bacterium RIFCSPLOWO2_01_44_7]|nr:MAG: hypothetical protein A2712_02510 [Deltaproteobacteria bacterium RIFCSPHIGHO2_01_FULL_43_49]OGQ16068.1 MAG: hypothetical protein A3D22_00480 [Deltaproteobacteria bacterium RIFCSPHIGHO2_02_FULL_44_53]OGQ29029.1 MAG: hypothetical protein A3D98_04265 [Deltaproteobacteria bacterium RIFCSPHIGHO2_12_FULL_44_21]OGQ32585.1 MAG: hypothetical protein A2979_08410 [Deltaproteobacteria bacterium RIFCSPLOWO2_01_FULL_45_74]OGQ38327.1 MAG: hypothetical protein A2W61_03030 [Deltaproteobacteria bacterium 